MLGSLRSKSIGYTSIGSNPPQNPINGDIWGETDSRGIGLTWIWSESLALWLSECFWIPPIQNGGLSSTGTTFYAAPTPSLSGTTNGLFVAEVQLRARTSAAYNSGNCFTFAIGWVPFEGSNGSIGSFTTQTLAANTTTSFSISPETLIASNNLLCLTSAATRVGAPATLVYRLAFKLRFYRSA